MKFLPSKKIPHADGLSRLILRIIEPLKETIIGSLTSDMDIKNIYHSKRSNSNFGRKKVQS